MDRLLAGEMTAGLHCDVKSLCLLAGVPRATLYRTYPHLRAEFDRRRAAAQDNRRQPDPRVARIDRLKTGSRPRSSTSVHGSPTGTVSSAS